MESAVGRISVIDEKYATVVVDGPVACQRCADGTGCGAGIFESAGRSREIRVAIPAGMSFRAGDKVELTIDGKFLLRAAMLAYGLPLAGMALFPLMAWFAVGNPGDTAAVLLAVFGLASGVLLGRRIMASESVCRQFVPTPGAVTGA